MLQTAQAINTITFLAISGLHFYWAFASLFGKKTIGSSAVLPEINGKSAFKPSVFSTFVVAIGLLFMAKLSSFNLLPGFGLNPLNPFIPYGNLVISVIFLIRAIGDFRMIGFFKFVDLKVSFSPFSFQRNLKKSKYSDESINSKRINGSKFAENDTKYYSPLCILISICTFLIYWNCK